MHELLHMHHCEFEVIQQPKTGAWYSWFLLHPALLSLGQNPKQQSTVARRLPLPRGRKVATAAAPYDAASTRQETREMDGLEGFEFFEIILENPSSRLRLPDKFTRVLLDGFKPKEVKLRAAGHGRRFWDVKVVLDADGHMYLGRGWEQFARAHDLRLGYFLVFSYDGDAVLTIKVFDMSMCRRHYQHDGDASSGSSSDGDSGSNNGSVGGNISGMVATMGIDDGPTSQFTVMLRESNLGVRQKQYLNVPADFQNAHGYGERTKVELRMRGKSWSVNLKHSPRNRGRPRASLRYGWHQFCVDNGLGVGDTCFFRALGDGGAGETHLLKVEVRKRNGGYVV
ncbi:B3 domain-containing protein [Hordeum vulgare]|nr:B3 domain-containing protein [Hordeum vulgare]